MKGEISLKDKNIVVCVTGGIAAYKVVNLVSMLKKQGADVTVILTENAAKFVAPITFQSISSNLVYMNIFDDRYSADIKHISLAQNADLVVIAPATANIIGKIANGIADDMISTTVMATNAPVIIVPAMNTAMYENPIVQHNISRLKEFNYTFMIPGVGSMAMPSEKGGIGRLPEPDKIFDYINNFDF
ncbi:bifunctional phosphopantothenoylcysteine decarboxylase/phosphopantothenate--cysteine ligase CoaBC [Oceanirhabdus seepicola]|uniref:Bifunctional phosphopantothenoylcysteine decarboxylase/phosphopantothenate--cysteine ligase CoaBC n=1 Tax=Oceanirhabdus seepicola TaxID=2828781 RepID=A0A9J6P3A0_9CLOT|nr:bifunctional phosphopantothenoylcysteine decarboxylase/phosphopantothenate--cysteine ligase CoaBC [Oceanirhabdus seepicola]MCM1990694.1 bifunctional phosphopantothenoylcysteine decarboxylase/phosphopantothenate--cysteine ligase CoaBC [Oceanirhabdus seepicola]